MSMVQQAIEVSAPLHTVYEQLAAVENYPRFMSGVQQVVPTGLDQTHWVMDVDGKRREFDARITERSMDERVSWATTEGPLLAETLTLRPLGETRTQVVAQLEADIAFLMPSDRHGQASLNRRLKDDLTTFKRLVESGTLGGRPVAAGRKPETSPQRPMPGASSKRLTPNPAAVAARIRNRNPHPGAGWGTSAAEHSNASSADLPYHGMTAARMGTNVDITSAPGIRSEHDLDDVLAPGRRIVRSDPGRGAAGTAPIGGRTTHKDTWGDGMINEEDRGSHDR
jgi:ribosome-associated toxin RatA of RatAB toxin-antitoxin module